MHYNCNQVIFSIKIFTIKYSKQRSKYQIDPVLKLWADISCIFIVISLNCIWVSEGESEIVTVLNEAPGHEAIGGCRGIAPIILNIRIRWK